MIEKERKYLIDWERFSKQMIGLSCRTVQINQWYCREQINGFDVRFRQKIDDTENMTLFMTMKKPTDDSSKRIEYETTIQMMRSEFKNMLEDLGIANRVIRKRRITSDHFPGELDIFESGLVLYETENWRTSVSLPSWVLQDVTDDPKYFNINMLKD